MKKKWISFLIALILAGQLFAGAGISESYAWDRETNQKQIYTYLTAQMGLNVAAACGIMANIERECGFNPDIIGGGRFYGLCQWGGSRRQDLISYCSQKGLDYKTVEGQMNYLEYELQKDYPELLQKLRTIACTQEGAYQAGYDWCYYFERPGNIVQESTKRGNLAMTTYWAMYGAAASLPFRSWIDSPAAGQHYEGTVRLEGWAILGEAITEIRAVVNDNELVCARKEREDVNVAYPEYNVKQAGFYANVPTAFLNEGANKVALYAYKGTVKYEIGTVEFTCSDLDVTKPVVTDVSVTDVNENGYTITCKVTDDGQIDRVQFPTWTEAGGQDDLDPQWMTSQTSRGTMEGDAVTCRIKVKDHDYESGVYLTHIYAIDTGGNMGMAMLECQVPEGAVRIGDLNGDKLVTAEDSLRVLRHVVKLEQLADTWMKAADADGDGGVTAQDALLILQRVVKLISAL